MLSWNIHVHMPLREVILNSGIYWILKKTLRHVLPFNFYFSRARWAVMIIAALSLGERLFFLKCFLIAVMIWYNDNIITIFAATVATGSRGIFYLEECYQKTPHNFMCFLSNLRTFCVISFTDAVNILDLISRGTYCVRYTCKILYKCWNKQ